MSKLLSRQGVRDLCLGLGLLCATLALMFWPQEAMEAAREGLRLCYNVILPSLFPFFVLSALVVDLGLAGYIGRALEGIMRPLFNVPGACASAFALGFVGGYPVGARTAPPPAGGRTDVPGAGPVAGGAGVAPGPLAAPVPGHPGAAGGAGRAGFRIGPGAAQRS